MKFEVETKYNIGDAVSGTMRETYRTVKFEGVIADVIVKYGNYADETIRDTFVPKAQYKIMYKVVNDLGIIYTVSESSLHQIKRTLDYFSTDELEEELKRRKENA